MKQIKVSIYLFLFALSILIVRPFKSFQEQSSETGIVKSGVAISTVINQTNQFHDVDSLLVIHFHPEVQCSCCIIVGNLARKAMERFHPKQYRDSVLIFRTYNIDEDTLTAEKYKIFWSALVFEKFCGEIKEFKEIESVWEFCEDEKMFLLDFKKEIDEFIVGSKKVESGDKDTQRMK